ncbi:MAG: NAD(P)-dependent glycerol-3-phosphate dehydrogenase [Rhodobacteraceae bacterium]|nr:MAG: NAD(P)-dependent glycerol-3-phosphate dehydrogenase [Paracoccaceae bacterium]
MTIAVLGAGAFGTALAVSLAGKGPVALWSRSAPHAAQMAQTRENSTRLPGMPLPEAIAVTAAIEEACRADILLLAVPMQTLRGVLRENQTLLGGKSLVACCKGIELASHRGPVSVIADCVPDARAALLTGPSFAADIARGLPTALTLACAEAEAAKGLQQALTTGNLRLYRTTDVIGAELGGALKNVMAIACGAVIGAGLGESARAALMTRGFAEIVRLGAALGADPRTLAGLSGLGDLALTCTSDLSRNYRLGLTIGQGGTTSDTATVEGVATARATADLARDMGLDLPVTQTVASLVGGQIDVATAIRQLMTRPLKEE